MVPFVIGVFVGACAAVGILGFIAAASDDPPAPPRPEELPYYMEDDGK